MRVLWAKAPLVLLRHPAVLVAVVAASTLVALAAAAAPFVRAGVESESLRGQLRAMTPLAAGLEIHSRGPSADDAGRRAAALAFARRLPFLGNPVLTSGIDDVVVRGVDGADVPVVVMARSYAVAHVGHLTPASGEGAWISSALATAARLRPGATVSLKQQHGLPGEPAPTLGTVRVAGIYRALDGDLANPYWANFSQDIQPRTPDSPLPPTYVLVPESTLLRLGRLEIVDNRFEFPVDPAHISLTRARDLERRFAAIDAELARPGSTLGRPLGCGVWLGVAPFRCTTTSSLDAALRVATHDVAAVAPIVSLLSDCAIALALVAAVAAGAFLVRRRAGEAQLLYARGESVTSFAVRTAVEGVLPAAAGCAAGVGLALLALRAFAPAGTIDARTVWAGAAHAAVAAGAALVAFGAGAAATFPRRADSARPWLRRLRTAPWELVPLAAAAALLADVLAGGGLARDVNGATHPRLAVFLLPAIATAGVAGLVVRAGRALLHRRAGHAPTTVFLAVRRLGAARGLLVAVVVTAAAAFAAFTYATVLSSSLGRSAAEKAYVSNGSDVQGLIDPSERIVNPLPFPAAAVQDDSSDVVLPSGGPVDLLAGDPAALARTIEWGKGWNDDPRTQLPRLSHARGLPLAAFATPGTPAVDAIVDQGARIPIRIVGRTRFPGTSAGRPALIVSASALHAAATRFGILDPGPAAIGLLWAKGDPARVEPILRASNLAPFYLTTTDHLRRNPSVEAAERTYGYFRAIGMAAAALSLLALLLYLQARQRSQLIASALARRMGLPAAADAAALALEAAAIVLVAAIAGLATALVTAQPLVHHVDPLPQYPPASLLIVPWLTLAVALAVATSVAALLGAAASAIAVRSNVAEALRVA